MKKFFILIFLLLLLCIVNNKNATAQLKLNEGFEGTLYPPVGWSVASSNPGDGVWSQSIRNQKSGNKCAVSNFTSGYSSNFLISKSFIPSPGDSLVFSFKQTFWNIYKDTFNIYISTTDSVYSSMTTRLFNFRDDLSYPSPLIYGTFAVSLSAFAGQRVWIGFQHINLDGDNLRLDDISVGKPVLNEVGVVENSFPYGTLGSCTFEKIIPQAKIQNFGSLNQSIPFNITYSVTGPVSYTSVRSDTLSAGYTKTIYFDTLNVIDTGTYSVKIFTSLSGDENISNDTITSMFNIRNTSFGGGLAINGGYFFSNSTLCSFPAPSQPKFCWKDTTGSKNLILNSSDVTNGLLTGNTDDGYFSLGTILQPGNKIKFFGSQYDSIFITTNGIIGFKKNDLLLSGNASRFGDLLSAQVPAIAAFWADMDFGDSTTGNNRLSYKVAGSQLIITYDRVNLKSGSATDYLSFQVSIEMVDSLSDNSKILFQYNKETSGVDFITGYINNTLPPHLIGLKNTSGNSYLVYRYRDSMDVAIRGPLFNSSLALEFGANQISLNNKCSQLDLTVLLEAVSHRRDTITVTVRDSRNGYKILESRTVYIDSAGNSACTLTIPNDSYKYYIVINHKNSIETWSKLNGETFSSYALDYDFTSDTVKAYGNNMILKNGRSHFYSGDVNQDGSVNAVDLTELYNNLNSFSTGYLRTDLDNDKKITLHDMLYCYNNNMKFTNLISP